MKKKRKTLGGEQILLNWPKSCCVWDSSVAERFWLTI